MLAISCLITFTIALSAPGALSEPNCLSENEIGVIPKTIRSDLYRGQQVFTIAMLEAIQKATPNENIFFSPYSTYHALLLAYFGSRGETEMELIKTLHLEWAKNKNHVSHGYRLEKQTREKRAQGMPLEFASADKIFFDESVKLTGCMKSIFDNELESVNFKQNAEECRQNINNWIAQITRNEIPEMLAPGDIDAQTQLALANAAYFKGQWANKFDSKDTQMEIFYTKGNQHSFVPMMHRRGTYNFGILENLGAQILQMPYQTSTDEKESEISMIIILPPTINNTLEKVLSKLTPDILEMALKYNMPREIDVALPKFEFEQRLELVPILRQMGINQIFEESADLSGFSTETKVMFGDAKHVAKIKIDEEGSTAAAATVFLSFRSARPIEPTQFICNHPFLFLIYDHTSKAILFAGIYRDPKTQK